VSLQGPAGVCLVIFGAIAFLDRDRPEQAHSHYYFVLPNFGPVIQAVIGVVFTALGFVLLFTA